MGTPSSIPLGHRHPLTFKIAQAHPLIYNRYPPSPLLLKNLPLKKPNHLFGKFSDTNALQEQYIIHTPGPYLLHLSPPHPFTISHFLSLYLSLSISFSLFPQKTLSVCVCPSLPPKAVMEIGNTSGNSYNSYQTHNWVDFSCRCGVKAPLRTSNSYANPGRRFLGCVNYQEEHACKFFDWVDPKTCPRRLEYGRHLLNKINELQKKEEDLKTLNEVAQMDKAKLMKKIDKLSTMNEALKKKNGSP